MRTFLKYFDNQYFPIMSKKKVLFVTQELNPYTEISMLSDLARRIPHFAAEEGFELRVLMPKFGIINERRHRLHEVVRLSGMNIIVDDEDYPLIIKVASLPGARLQVYFLDNEEFFADGIISGNESSNEIVTKYGLDLEMPIVTYDDDIDASAKATVEFYKTILEV